jgi:C-terminal processing protease CtpA/Prc
LGYVHGILRDAYLEIKKNYYDATFKGIDLEARYRAFDSQVDKSRTVGEGFGVVAAFLGQFHDSHLFFEPPLRGASFESGYRMQMIGDRCFVTSVRYAGDASTKLHPGDWVRRFDGYVVNREDFHDLQYYFHQLAPSHVEQLELVAPAGAVRVETIQALVRPNKREIDLTEETADFWDLVREDENDAHMKRERIANLDGIIIWKMAQFGFDIETLDHVMSAARKGTALIIDLRGNPGGFEESLQMLVGKLFDHDVKIADRVTRKPDKPVLAKHLGDPFTGKLIVLVDGGSASSSELLAKVVQLEKRGLVLGDRTAGAVMEAKQYTDSQAVDSKIFYGFSVSHANLIMSDGKSLEGTGVMPDQLVLPSAEDLAAGRDPVLSHAVTSAGGTLDPAAAGKLFPYEWPHF